MSVQFPSSHRPGYAGLIDSVLTDLSHLPLIRSSPSSSLALLISGECYTGKQDSQLEQTNTDLQRRRY